MSHTKGPWSIAVADKSKDGFTLYSQSGVKPGEQWANATLIAAAPDLLEALQKLLLDHECTNGPGSGGCNHCVDAHVALFRAEGKS